MSLKNEISDHDKITNKGIRIYISKDEVSEKGEVKDSNFVTDLEKEETHSRGYYTVIESELGSKKGEDSSDDDEEGDEEGKKSKEGEEGEEGKEGEEGEEGKEGKKGKEGKEGEEGEEKGSDENI